MFLDEVRVIELPCSTTGVFRDERETGRRSFLGLLAGVGAAAVAAVISLPFLRYMVYPLHEEASRGQWFDLGPLDQFASTAGPTRKLVNIQRLDGWQQTVSQQAVYVTHDAEGSLSVLSSVCPHLGCSVAWKPETAQFVCPCHGGCFAADGARVSGPPPTGMSVLPAKAEGARLMVSYSPVAGRSKVA
jgi:Rieske Fe-S protein